MKKSILVLILSIVILAGLSACSEPVEKLSQPQNLRVELRVISWDPVENASGYLVYFQQEEYLVEECSLNIRFVTEGGQYRVSVIALGDGKGYEDSLLAELEFELETPFEHGFDQYGFEYTLLEDKSGYEFSRGTADLQGHICIPDMAGDYPVTRIADSAFMSDMDKSLLTENGCNRVTTGITLPKYLKSIGSHAFAYMVQLKEIVIPDGVQIGVSAFRGCKRLERVVLPSDLKEIPNSCFQDTALEEIVLPDALEVIGDAAFRTQWYYGSGGKQYYVKSQLSSIVIPDSVKTIGYAAFAGRENLRQVKLSQNLEQMGHVVFDSTPWYDSQPEGLVYLGDILYTYKGDIPEGTELEIPAHTKGIAAQAFINQPGLSKVWIPDGVKLLGQGIFNRCINLSEIKLPDGIKTIYNSTFNKCLSLKQIIIPESVTVIERAAFSGSGLQSVIIPSNVLTIGEIAFKDCIGLKQIILPDGLAYLGGGAFNGCTALVTAYLPASIQELKTYPFLNCNSLTCIFYDGSSTEQLMDTIKVDQMAQVKPAYQSAPIYYYSETEPTEPGNYWRYVDGIPTPWE